MQYSKLVCTNQNQMPCRALTSRLVLLVLPLTGESTDSVSVWVIALPWDLLELLHIHLAKDIGMHESSNLVSCVNTEQQRVLTPKAGIGNAALPGSCCVHRRQC